MARGGVCKLCGQLARWLGCLLVARLRASLSVESKAGAVDWERL
jgi:hypothetical protein